MKLITKSKDVLIPKWNGNRDLPPAEQVKIHLRYPTNRERENITTIEYKDGGKAFEYKHDSDQIIGECVTKIDNLYDVVDGKEKKIVNGHDLLASQNKVLSGLVQEIAVVILRADDLDEETEKNSDAP